MGFHLTPFHVKRLSVPSWRLRSAILQNLFLNIPVLALSLPHLESFIRCLCEGRYIQDVIHVIYRLKEAGVCLAIMTWKAALSGCLKVGRTDIIWKLYQEMIECGVVADVELRLLDISFKLFVLITGFWRVTNFFDRF
ncbi:unnamed protein product [Prunus brigantina]